MDKQQQTNLIMKCEILTNALHIAIGKLVESDWYHADSETPMTYFDWCKELLEAAEDDFRKEFELSKNMKDMN